ncbi:MAG TPA: hypothetical protein VFN26_11635 [Candidatus Acidoferrum sp.]|nr:hypothetical protein [Candidatus Acidoferrum sp.]
MSTDKQVERMKRSVLFFLRKFGTNGAAQFQVLGGYTALGREIRLAAIAELLAEGKIEKRFGHVLRIKVQS